MLYLFYIQFVKMIGFMRKMGILYAVIFAFLPFLAMAENSDNLKSGFKSPPVESLPRTWWHWIDGNITEEGITADLEAMRKVGIGSATILDITSGLPKGPVKTLSPRWYELVNHAVKEAERLGMEITVHNCPGWSSSGGPWIKPEDAMKEIAWTQTAVKGGGEVNIKLPKAQGKLGFYKDIAVVAYPSLAGESDVFKNAGFKIIKNFPTAKELKVPAYMPDYIKVTQEAEDLLGADWRKVAMLRPAKDNTPGDSVVFEFDKPYSIGGLKVSIGGPPYNAFAVFDIWVSDDGKNFRKHFTTAPMRHPAAESGFSAATAKFVKVELVGSNDGKPVSLYNMSFYPYVKIPDIDLKIFSKWGTIPRRESPEGIKPIAKNSIVDLSKYMDSEGNLKWRAPAGDWTVLRFGMVCNGRGNHPATPEGSGLECDKMSKRGVDAVWSGMMSKIVSNAGESAGKVLSATLIDSYEVGPQNWTDDFPAEFKELRGYDIVKNLPILTGRYVESADYSERFLQDFRRTIADLFAKYYGKYFSELVAKSGLKFISEPYGGPFDELLQGRYADIPMGEFWSGWNNTGNARLASNIAQINGRKFVQTETFTSGPGECWKSTPANHKTQGDNAFSEGVNRFVFHSYAHQAYERNGAGITMGIWGFHFNRKNTLWDFYDGWLSYIGKSQFMLQQGKFSASALYIAPEEVPCITPLTQIYAAKDFYCGVDLFAPNLPFGYAGNVCEPYAAFDSISVSDGKIRLKSGMKYDILIANNTETISDRLLGKIRSFANDGAIVLLGNPPKKSFGLSGYPKNQKRFDSLVSELWGGLDGTSKTSKKLGKGRVFFGVSPESVLREIGVKPDFSATRVDGKKLEDIKYILRKTESADIYFIANQAESGLAAFINAEFASACPSPEIWDAETGKIVPASVWDSSGGRTVAQLALLPRQSLFVVFDKNAEAYPHLKKAKWEPSKKLSERLVVEKALWRSTDGSKGADVTELVRSKIKDSSLKLSATSGELGGDAAPNMPKVLEVFYSIDGKKESLAVNEWKSAEIKCPPLSESGLPDREFAVERRGGKMFLRAWAEGSFEALSADGKEIKINPGKIPEKIDLSRGWTVELKNSGVKKFRKNKLESLSKSGNPDVKYFSGTARYSKKFNLPEGFLSDVVAFDLDLGKVRDIARVRLNGKDIGNLWYPPYSREVTEALKEGENILEVEVANTWFNRLVGDETLPEDAEWKPRNSNGQLLKSFPDWYMKGEKSPSGRKAFTTFRNWRKDSPLIESGLIGPVILRPSKLSALEL